jgi:hypothetical protein
MPKKNSDYSNTIIYKIYCKDENIKDVYVGHTINFTQRKYSHAKACNNLNNSVRIYKTIRATGGWENWNMVEIATYCCKDLTEARIKENEHYIELQASLNSSQPYVNRKVNKVNKEVKKYTCSICNLEVINFEEYNCHVKNCIIINNITDENLVDENNIKENLVDENNDGVYICNYCNYSTNKKSNYDRHLLSSKHKNNSNGLTIKQYNCEQCNKIFITRSALWKHNNKYHNNNEINKLTTALNNLTNKVNILAKNINNIYF